MKKLKKVLIFIAVFVFVIWAFFFFAFDPLLKLGIRKSIEACTGAKAEIALLKTKFLHPTLEIKGLAAASSSDEYKNYIEFSELKFEIEGLPLLKKRFIASEANLTGLRFGTARQTSGKLHGGKNRLKILNKAASEYIANMKAETESYTLQRKEDLISDFTINPDDLKTVKLAKALEAEYKQKYEDISAQINEDKYKKQIEELKNLYVSAKKESNVLKQAKAYSDILKKAKDIKTNFAADKKKITETIAGVKSSIKQLEQAKKEDLASIKAKMQLPAFDAESIAKMLAGPAMADKVDMVFRIIEIAKTYMNENDSSHAAEKENSETDKKEEHSLPAFLIKKMNISGEFGNEKPLGISGSLTDFTTEPALYDKPAVLVLKGAQAGKVFDFSGNLSSEAGKILTNSKITFKGANIDAFNFGSEKSLLVAMSKAMGDLTANLSTTGNALEGLASLRLYETTFVPSSEKLTGTVKNAVDTAFKIIKETNIGLSISGDYPKPKLGLTTDMASRLSDGLKAAASYEVQKATAKAQEKIEEAAKPYMAKVLGTSAAGEQLLNSKLTALQNLINKETSFGK